MTDSDSRNGNRSASAGQGRVGPGMMVRLTYAVYDAEGDEVGAQEEPLECVTCAGQLLPVVERAIDGCQVGETVVVHLRPNEGFGPRDPEAVLRVERDEFPEDVQPGDHFEIENAEGKVLVVRVLEVEPEEVRLDLNHPLAGQDLRVELQVLGVRPATSQEQEQAFAAADPVGNDEGPLLSPHRLLRGRVRR